MLLDLDELVLSCHDPRSQEYIREAVLCYKTGAYRASVVACWIAVAFDIVDKIRELAAGGDKMAEQEVARFEKVQKNNDIKGALEFEKDLPKMALKFEFLSHIEFEDLGRLVMDRNRCAHPSHVIDSEVFTPSAELARLHISNAVKSVLSRPATSGKSALDVVMLDMASRYYPGKLDKVIEFLSEGPLGRPRVSLFRGFVIVQLKNIFTGSHKDVSKARATTALAAVKQMHPQLWTSEFPPAFNLQVSNLRDDDALNRAISLIVYNLPMKYWSELTGVQQERLVNYVKNAPVELLDDFEVLLSLGGEHSSLKVAAEERIARCSFAELKDIGWLLAIPEQALGRALDIYASSRDFAEANEFGRYLRAIIPDCIGVEKHTNKFLNAIKRNDQVYYSNELGGVVRVFLSVIGVEKLKEELRIIDLDLDRYIPA